MVSRLSALERQVREAATSDRHKDARRRKEGKILVRTPAKSPVDHAATLGELLLDAIDVLKRQIGAEAIAEGRVANEHAMFHIGQRNSAVVRRIECVAARFCLQLWQYAAHSMIVRLLKHIAEPKVDCSKAPAIKLVWFYSSEPSPEDCTKGLIARRRAALLQLRA